MRVPRLITGIAKESITILDESFEKDVAYIFELQERVEMTPSSIHPNEIPIKKDPFRVIYNEKKFDLYDNQFSFYHI